MTNLIINMIMYFIFMGGIGLGRCVGERYKWYDRLIGFLFGWAIVPIVIGILLRKKV